MSWPGSGLSHRALPTHFHHRYTSELKEILLVTEEAEMRFWKPGSFEDETASACSSFGSLLKCHLLSKASLKAQSSLLPSAVGFFQDTDHHL